MSGKTSPILDALVRGLYGWDYEIKSEPTHEYNCLAFAADDEERWWWPQGAPYSYWPDDVPNEVTVEAFLFAYQSIGYEPCPDDSFDPSYEKVVLYLDARRTPTHAAKQIDELYWKSKLGHYHDIQHPLRALEEEYGREFVFLRRNKRPLVE